MSHAIVGGMAMHVIAPTVTTTSSVRNEEAAQQRFGAGDNVDF
jgi:hypothetical protein